MSHRVNYEAAASISQPPWLDYETSRWINKNYYPSLSLTMHQNTVYSADTNNQEKSYAKASEVVLMADAKSTPC